MKRMSVSIGLIALILLTSHVVAETPQSIDRMFYSEPYYSVEAGIFERSQRHALYAYIISNMTTPGFDPMKYLPAEDQADLKAIVPDKKFTREILVEFLMTRMSDNNRKDTALMTIWKNKKDSLQRIVTLGK
jgi:hypothetical protein